MARFLAVTPGASPGQFVAEQACWWDASPRAFGGQIIAHCVAAAAAASPFAHPHSVHVHFVAASRMIRTVYTVRPLREGRSYALYAVEGVEAADGRVIAVATVGFQAVSAADGRWPGGVLHAAPIPRVPPPSACPPSAQRAWDDSKAEGLAQRAWRMREVNGSPNLTWVAWDTDPSTQPLADTPAEHACAVGFMSDLAFLWAAFWPHERDYTVAMLTSLDHAIHWHAPDARASEWLLFQIESPFAGAERGLVRGLIWTEDGTLVASVVQEGVVRMRPRAGPSKL